CHNLSTMGTKAPPVVAPDVKAPPCSAKASLTKESPNYVQTPYIFPYPNPKCLVDERSQSPTTNFSSLYNPSSLEEETNIGKPYSNENGKIDNSYPSYCNNADQNVSSNLYDDATNKTSRGHGGPRGDSVSMLDEEHGMGKINGMPISDAIDL
ncbi:unnamed protein product, partial [Ilex paraguariensis]